MKVKIITTSCQKLSFDDVESLVYYSDSSKQFSIPELRIYHWELLNAEVSSVVKVKNCAYIPITDIETMKIKGD